MTTITRTNDGRPLMGQYHELWAFDATDPTNVVAEHLQHYELGAGAKLLEQCYSFDNRQWDSELRAYVGEKPKYRGTSPFASAVGLMVLGPWAGKRLIVIGDYAEDSDVPGFEGPVPGAGLSQYYGMAEYGWIPSDREDGPEVVPEQVRLVTETARMLLGEAAGWSFDGSGGAWADQHAADDWDHRAERWAAMEGEPHVISSSKGEFIRPEALGSPVVPMAMPFLGAAWPAAIAMLACSDGRGGGDLRLEPQGRWAYSVLAMVPASSVGAFTDVTPWLLGQKNAHYLTE